MSPTHCPKCGNLIDQCNCQPTEQTIAQITNKRDDKRQTKSDDGIARIDAKMSDGSTKSFPLKEAVRDALNKRPHPTDSAYKERVALMQLEAEAERKVDASQYTTAELEANRYSGYRVNHLAGKFEIWCLGKVAASERIERVKRNPGIIADLHERAFSTAGTVVSADLNTQMKNLPDDPTTKAN